MIKLRNFLYVTFALRNLADAAVLAKIVELNRAGISPTATQLHLAMTQDTRSHSAFRALLKRFTDDNLIVDQSPKGVWTVRMTRKLDAIASQFLSGQAT